MTSRCPISRASVDEISSPYVFLYMARNSSTAESDRGKGALCHRRLWRDTRTLLLAHSRIQAQGFTEELGSRAMFLPGELVSQGN